MQALITPAIRVFLKSRGTNFVVEASRSDYRSGYGYFTGSRGTAGRRGRGYRANQIPRRLSGLSADTWPRERASRRSDKSREPRETMILEEKGRPEKPTAIIVRGFEDPFRPLRHPEPSTLLGKRSPFFLTPTLLGRPPCFSFFRLLSRAGSRSRFNGSTEDTAVRRKNNSADGISVGARRIGQRFRCFFFFSPSFPFAPRVSRPFRGILFFTRSGEISLFFNTAVFQSLRLFRTW